MKEATGELNMTVITVVALAAVGALFYSFVWPMIKGSIVTKTCQTMGANYTASQKENCGQNDGCFAAEEDDADSTGKIWCCCPTTEE